MERSAKSDTASALQQALLSVRELKAALQRSEEPIAIVGAACRLPGADTLEAFWSLLSQRRDAIKEVPVSRWSSAQLYDPDPMAQGKLSTRWAGVIDECGFDAGFFGISDAEAVHMDAQQRIFLEVAWEALVHAGQTRDELRGSQTGVYVGVVNYNDGYARRLFDDIERITAFSGPGVSNSVLAGRLSYLFDLKGPCLAIDTACSSSLVAVHQACQSLRNNECGQAIAGGVNLILSPEFTVATSRMGLMAADGRCKPFDERADGIVRSDGCGVIVLKRLSDATRDGNRVLAVIQASAVNQDGRTNGMTAPNGLAQEALLRKLLMRAGLTADNLGYVEAHGTGTKLGDPIEIAALTSVLGTRTGRPPCLIGSVKGNIGHCEAAAGIASLIKTVLCLQHRSVPGFVDLRTLNRHIDAQSSLAFPQASQAWPHIDGKPLFGLVSSFGWSGTNAQVILGSAPAGRSAVSASLYTMAAATGDELCRAVASACVALNELPADQSVEPVSSTVTGGFRKAFVTSTAGRMAGDMRRWLERGIEPHGPGEKLALVFSGQGSQWPGMVDQLLAQDVVFRRSLQDSEAVIERLGGWSLLEAIAARSETNLALTQWAQPSIVAIQLAMFDMLVSWGLEPAAVAGHSIGELSAACCAGILEREQVLQAALSRGRCMAVLHGQGSMHALLASPQTVSQIVDGCTGASVSASNSPAASIVSVAASSLACFQERCANAGVESVEVNRHYPFHCSQLEPLQDGLQEAFAHLRHSQSVVSFVSSSHVDGEALIPREGSYWVRNAVRPVRFDLAVARLAQLGCDTFVELGPHASLVQHIQRCVGVSHRGIRTMTVLNRHKPFEQSLNELLAGLYEAGQMLHVDMKVAPGHHVWRHSIYELPALDKTAPEAGRAAATSIPMADHGEHRIFDAHWQGVGLLADHCMFDRVVVPGAMHLSVLATQALRQMSMPTVCIRDMRFLRPLLMSHAEQRQAFFAWRRMEEERGYQVTVEADIDGVRQALSCATVNVIEPTSLTSSMHWPALGAGARQLDCQRFYDRARTSGLQLGPFFRRIEAMWLDEQEQLMQVHLLASSEVSLGKHLVLDPGLLDSCFQALFAGYWQQCPEMDLYIPLAVEEMMLAGTVTGALRATIRLGTATFDQHSQIVQGDILLCDEHGRQVASLRNIQLKRAPRDALLSAEQEKVTRACRLAWRAIAMTTLQQTRPCPALVGDNPLAGLLATRLVQRGHAVLTAPSPGAQSMQWIFTEGNAVDEVADWSAILGQRLEQMRNLCAQIEAFAVADARLCVVTQAAHDPLGGGQHLLAAATLAVLRVIATEFPVIRCQAIDLPGQWPPSQADLDTLVALLAKEPSANLLRVEQAQVFEQVVEPARREPGEPLSVQPQGRYLITGGFADTGQALLQALLERGARHVTLMGRGRPAQMLVEQAKRLNQRGMDVHLFQGDLTSVADIDGLMRHVTRKGQPLLGIMHLAGAVEDALLPRLDAQMIARVLAPKVTGTVNLHNAVQSQPLQWFVAFSSLSACIGLAGQAAYAAANAFVQAFMAQRRAMGLVGQAIAWGPWSAGMTARLSARHQQQLETIGLGQMRLDEVVEWALNCAAPDDPPIAMVAMASPMALGKLVRLQGRQAAATLSQAPSELVALQGSPERLHAAMTRLVIEELAQATRNDALRGETPLAGLGLDSLGAVAIVQRIRQRTGKALPITAFFDSRTLNDVVIKLLANA